MSGNSSANNSWTILTPQETVAETLKPLAEGTAHHGESLSSAAGSGENQPADCAESAERLPVEGHLVSEEETAELSGDASTEQHTAVTDASAPTSLEVSGSFVAGSDALSQSEGLPEGPALSGPDPDSFSDSYTHINPSPDEPSASLLSTETLGGVEFTQEEESLTQEEESLTQEGTQHLLNGEELQQGGEESDLFPKTTDLWKQADSLVDSEVDEGRTEKTGEEAEPELRRRRSLLAVLERIGRTEEEEEEEEEFQPPQREEDSGFSVNKCILGAVILLGLGTIFFSGVFMDLDEESDYGTMELKDAEAAGKQEWLNPEVPPLPVDADSSVLLNKLADENQQISMLQAQLQEQKEELKVAKVQAEEGAKEQLQWEEMEKENTASEAAQAAVEPITSPPSGQPENSMQDSAGSTETQPKKPRDDQREKRKDLKKDKMDMGEKEWKERNKSEWKEGEKRERKDGGKTEWKQGNHEQGKFDKEKDKDGKQKRHSEETKKGKEKEWKKEKTSRGDGGKQWKDKEGNKEWVEKSERKERKEEKDWKKANHENLKDGKQWRGKEEKKDWKVGKDHGGKGKEEWKKGKDGLEESGKEKWEKKDSKKKEFKKKDGDWRSKDSSKEGKVKAERKQWEESKYHGKEKKGKNEKKQWNENERKSKNGKEDEEWRKKDERKQWNKNERKSKNGKDDDDQEWRKKDEMKQWEKKEDSWKRGGGERDKKHNGDWKKERSSHKEEHKPKVDHGHKAERLWADGKLPHTHSRPSLEQPEYWAQQRLRLQHSPKPPQQCNSLETCALTEGLLPVPFPEFEAILQSYLAKAEEAGVEESKREELKKLSSEFFRDGVFVHDQTSFQEFVEDLGDILEDMVEGDDDDEDEEEDSDLEEAMEEFEREVMKKFSVPEAVETESGRGRG